MPHPANRFAPALAAAVSSLPASLAAGGRGWCVAVASILEAAAAKPGNVHPAAAFSDLSFADLVAAGIAIAPLLDAAATQPLGHTILGAVQAAGRVTSTNANLGIVLLVAPVAAVPDPTEVSAAAVAGVLASTGSADAAAVWEAIRVARPGGLGRSGRWDIADPPPPDIREAMRAAADRDTIARLWAAGYDDLFTGPVADLAAAVAAGWPLEGAIIRCHLRQLAREPDSLIVRRHGADVAADVARRAAALVAREPASPSEAATSGWLADVAAFDASLRSPRRLNPGTTADLVAAALYILLLDGRLSAIVAAELQRVHVP